MNYLDIAKLKTVFGAEDARFVLDGNCTGMHESLLRSYQILAKVKWLLEKNTATEVVLELIALMETREGEARA